MNLERIVDKYNTYKVWLIKRYKCGTYYLNQEFDGRVCKGGYIRVTKKHLKGMGLLE